MNLRYALLPKTLRLPDSKYNKSVTLHLYAGQPTLIVDGLIQSGEILSRIWRIGIQRLLPDTFVPDKVLILGVGGGSNTLLIRKMYPSAHITAVDIDQTMIDIGKKYFGLEKVGNLDLITADALEYIKKLNIKTRFDLVLVDCFEGKHIPQKLEDMKFILAIKKHSRYTLINRIYWYDHYESTMNFLLKLSKETNFVTIKTRSNTIISLI